MITWLGTKYDYGILCNQTFNYCKKIEIFALSNFFVSLVRIDFGTYTLKKNKKTKINQEAE